MGPGFESQRDHRKPLNRVAFFCFDRFGLRINSDRLDQDQNLGTRYKYLVSRKQEYLSFIFDCIN
jgi:hypothetical protein